MSVKDVVLDMVKDEKCGYTLSDVDPQPVPTDGKAKWRGNEGGGFTHQGPCEIYIDDKMVLHSDNCEDEFPGGDPESEEMAEMPVDYSSCKGDCMLTIHWLAFQNADWQAYINCVPLSGNGQSTSSGERSSTANKTPTTQGSTASQEKDNSSEEQAPSSGQQSTPAPSTQKESTQPPSGQQQWTQAPSTQAPATEQRSSVNFTTFS